MLSNLLSKIYLELKKYWLSWGIALVFLIFFALIIFENSAIFLEQRNVEHTVVNMQKNGVPIGEITDDIIISQTFIPQKDEFSQIRIPFGTYNRQNEGTINIEIKEADSKKEIYKQSINVKELVDLKNINIDFNKVKNAKGKKYEFTLASQGLKTGKTVTTLKSATDVLPGELTINGKIQVGDLFINVLDIEKKPLLSKDMFVLMEILFLVIFILSMAALRRYKNQLHIAFLVTVLPIGLIMTVIFPPFDQLDELEHFPRAFEVSEGKFINRVTNQGLGNYIPVSLMDTISETRYIHQEGYKYSIVKEAFAKKLDPDKRIFMRNNASVYPPLMYIPQSIGINVGRVLFNSPLMMMYLGRVFNLLAYIAIMFTAIKIVPIKKTLFYILSLMPIAIVHASSLSADTITNSSALLFVSYILYLAFGKVKNIKMKHIVVITAIGVFVTLSKLVYFPIVFLFLILPVEKFENKMDFMKKFAWVLAGCLIPFLLWNMLNIFNLAVPDRRLGAGVSPIKQVIFILSNPIQYTKIIIDTMLVSGPDQLLAMVGAKVTNYSYSAPSIVLYSFIFLLMFFGIVNDEEDLNINIKKINRFIFLFIFLSVFILIYTALYVGSTNVGSPLIGGIQGRYFIPIAVFFFISLSNSKIINYDRKINFLVITIINCAIYRLLLNYIFLINKT